MCNEPVTRQAQSGSWALGSGPWAVSSVFWCFHWSAHTMKARGRTQDTDWSRQSRRPVPVVNVALQ